MIATGTAHTTKRKTILCGWLALALVSLVLPVFAHHSFSAEYDGTKLIYVTGTMTKVDWSNPHIHFYVTEKSSDGKAILWSFEGAASVLVERAGTRRADLMAMIGKEVTVRAAAARVIPSKGAAETVKIAGGAEYVVGGRRYSGGNN